MQKIEKINYFDLIEVNKKINNPFSREIFISTIKKEYGNGYTIFLTSSLGHPKLFDISF